MIDKLFHPMIFCGIRFCKKKKQKSEEKTTEIIIIRLN